MGDLSAPSYALWNTLHDGVIVAIDGTVPGEPVLEVEIGYLAGRLCPGTKSVFVRLVDCSSFLYDFRSSMEETVRLSVLSEIAESRPIIMAGEQDLDGVLIECWCGAIQCRYSSACIMLENKAPIAYETLLAECERYWRDWGTI